MNRLNLVILTFLLFVACRQNNEKKKTSDLITRDSIEIQQDEEIEPDTKELRKEYISEYNNVESLDTTIIENDGKIIHIHTKYYCLFDNAITVPGHYVWEDTTKTFKTHNFAQDIKISIDKDTIFKKTITKKYFESKLTPELKSYAVLMFPNFSFNKEKGIFDFGYSLTIPITDVGSGMRLIIDRKGKMTITD